MRGVSISVAPGHISLFPGESKELRVRIKNSGPHPAYWLHLKPPAGKDQAIRLDPPDPLLKGRGKQIWKPDRIAKLEPGETAALYARVRLNSKLPAALIKAGMHQLVLTVASAGNTEVSQTINVEVKLPDP